MALRWVAQSPVRPPHEVVFLGLPKLSIRIHQTLCIHRRVFVLRAIPLLIPLLLYISSISQSLSLIMCFLPQQSLRNSKSVSSINMFVLKLYRTNPGVKSEFGTERAVPAPSVSPVMPIIKLPASKLRADVFLYIPDLHAKSSPGTGLEATK